MSYDPNLRPRNGAVGKKDFEAYFQDRRFYEVGAGHAAYNNEDTAAYFSFEWVDAREDDEEGEFYPIAFNINYFRPSYFIMEAEIEVSAFVRAFDLIVSDPQWKGMSKGEYDAKVLISGWNAGNQSGCDFAVEWPEQRSRLRTLPSATLPGPWLLSTTTKHLPKSSNSYSGGHQNRCHSLFGREMQCSIARSPSERLRGCQEMRARLW